MGKELAIPTDQCQKGQIQPYATNGSMDAVMSMPNTAVKEEEE
jgi:hypothetical protein